MKKFLNRKVLLVSILMATIFLAIISTNFFSQSLQLEIAQNSSTVVASHEVKIYFVICAKSQSKLEAETIKNDYENISKFVWQEGEYFYVVHSAYEMENDANKVKATLEKSGMKTEVKSICLPPLSIDGNFSSEELNLLNECQGSFLITFRNLYDLHVGLETGVYSTAHCNDKLQKLKENHQKLCEKFDFSFKNDQNEQIASLGEKLKGVQEGLNKIEAKIESIKFASIQILDIWRN